MGTSGALSTSNQYVKYSMTINQNWQGIANNYSNVTVSVYFYRTNSGYSTYGTGTVWCKINGTTYSASVSPSQKITNSGIILFSQSVNIGHNSDGSKYLDCYAWISLDTPLSSSEQWYGEWLSTIPRNATCTDATNFNDEQNPTIYFTNPGNFDLQLKMEAGGDTALIVRDKVTRSSPYTFSLSTAERNLLRAKCPNSNTLAVRFTVGTYMSGSITNWSYVDRTMTIVNANPTFSSSQLTYQDTNSSIVAITQNNQHIVRNQSSLSATYTAATALKYASISKYQITLGGSTIERTSAGTISYDFVDYSSNVALSIKAIDSRSNSTTISKTITIFDWTTPSAIITANRKNNYENTTYLKADATISSVNSKNALQSIQYRYKQTTSSTYSSYYPLQNGVQTTISINNLYAWDFQLVVTDKFGLTTYNFVIAKGIPIMFFDTQKLSVGINKFPSNSGTLETNDIYMNAKKILDLVYPIGAIYLSVNSTDPSILLGGTWVRFAKSSTLVGLDESNADGWFKTPEWKGGSRDHRHAWRIGMHWWYGAAVGESTGNATGAYRYSDGQSTVGREVFRVNLCR